VLALCIFTNIEKLIIFDTRLQIIRPMPLSAIFPTARQATLSLCFLTTLALTPAANAAVTTGWNYEIKFDDAHGFVSNPIPTDVEGRAGTAQAGGGTWTGSNTKSYDVLRNGGGNYYAPGSDGKTDFTIKSQVLSSNNQWSRMNATIDSNNGLGVNATMQSGKSRPGDWGVVAYTVSFDASLGIKASDLSMRLSNVNGDGEIYEWAMVTLGEANQTPFSSLDANGKLQTTIGTYKNTDHSNFANSSFYNADGSTKVGGTATGLQLPQGKTITQFLAGQPAGSGDYLNADGTLRNRGTHIVDNRWVALDNFTAKVFDAAPSDSNTSAPINPRNYSSNYDDEVDITGAQLGMGPDDAVTSFTIWLGYSDVATAKADGFSRTNADMFSYVSNIKVGNSFAVVPEPSTAALALLAGSCLLRRRRK
jgi:hypothetical protein